jgi:hypothetical protein
MVYLYRYYESKNATEYSRLQQRARAYPIVDNDLYKTSVSGPLLWCAIKAEGQELLLEIHAGI